MQHITQCDERNNAHPPYPSFFAKFSYHTLFINTVFAGICPIMATNVPRLASQIFAGLALTPSHQGVRYIKIYPCMMASIFLWLCMSPKKRYSASSIGTLEILVVGRRSLKLTHRGTMLLSVNEGTQKGHR